MQQWGKVLSGGASCGGWGRAPIMRRKPMAAAENSDGGELLFVSNFDNKVDEKRRVQVPSLWRRGKAAGIRYMILAVPKRNMRPACLAVLTPEYYLKRIAALREMKMSDDRADSLRRLLAARATEVETDSAGRICLPEEAARSVDIKDKAKLAGMIEWFEIWNPDRYEEISRGDDERAPDAYQLV